MTFFNYKKLYIAARGDPGTIVKYFLSNPLGVGNYILNEVPLRASNSKISLYHRAEYLHILSYRNLTDYYIKGEISLPLEFLPPQININHLELNPLIEIDRVKNRLEFPAERKAYDYNLSKRS